MKEIPGGFTFWLSADGTELVCGYQSNCRRVHLAAGIEEPWPNAGEWYAGGWNGALPIFFTPTAVSPPQTLALSWDQVQLGSKAEAIGHGGLAVIDGHRLSTNGQRIWHDGIDITPLEAFNGPVWDDIHAYGYKRGWDGGGPFVVRSLPTNVVVLVIDAGGMYERPYSLFDGVWVTGQYPGGSRVYPPPTGSPWPLPEHELAGPVLERNGIVYVVTAVMGAVNNPRGVMVRPWSELTSGGLKGWFCEGVRHQMLQARVNPAGEMVVAGCEFPGSGLITIGTIERDRPMGLVPPEPTDPIDPEEPEEPVDPILLKRLEDIDKKLAIIIELGAKQETLGRVETHSKAERSGTVGSVFGTQQMKIRQIP